VPIDGGVRLDIASALQRKEMNTWRIQELLGAGSARKRVLGQ
jgi:hypothetical protein